jgi:hypothetical protein
MIQKYTSNGHWSSETCFAKSCAEQALLLLKQEQVSLPTPRSILRSSATAKDELQRTTQPTEVPVLRSHSVGGLTQEGHPGSQHGERCEARCLACVQLHQIAGLEKEVQKGSDKQQHSPFVKIRTFYLNSSTCLVSL